MEWNTVSRPKRKYSGSPNIAKSIVANKVKKAKSTSGRVNRKPPHNLSPSPEPVKPVDAETASNEAKDPEDPATITPKAVKPVFVESNFQVVNNQINAMQFGKKPLLKIVTKTKIQVSCFSHEDKTKLLASLAMKKLPHFTYSEPSEKSSIFVLRGYHKISVDEMKMSIIEEGIQATKVTFLADNEEAPIYIVHFAKGTANFNDLVYNHKTIGNIIVKWEKLDHNRKRPTQCHNCQQWGHSARNCGREFQCVKCINTHQPGKCERITREGDAKCVNCKGNHPANSRQCPSFLNYQERTTRRRAPARFTSTPAPWTNIGPNPSQRRNEFPPLPARHAYTTTPASLTDEEQQSHPQEKQRPVSFNRNPTSSNVPRPRNHNSNTESFASLHAKFQSIPEIDVTMRLFGELIDQLGSTASHQERLMIMMRYCSPQTSQNAP